jgi:hypothetical protein
MIIHFKIMKGISIIILLIVLMTTCEKTSKYSYQEFEQTSQLGTKPPEPPIKRTICYECVWVYTDMDTTVTDTIYECKKSKAYIDSLCKMLNTSNREYVSSFNCTILN